MFSNLPNLADRAFIIGFLVPTLVLLLALCWLFSDLPLVQEITTSLGQADSLEKLLYAGAFVWFVALLLLMLNHTILQMLEGYKGPLANGVARRRARRAFEQVKSEYEALAARWRLEGATFPSADEKRYERLERRLNEEFPPEPFLLPTRFGNAIRAFESYPLEMYGADSIPLWPHLLSVASDPFLAALDDARAHVDCLANLVVVGLLVALLAILRLIFADGSVAVFDPGKAEYVLGNSAELSFLFTAIVALAAAWCAYRMAVERAIAWGRPVRALFDCYLPELAAKMGYEGGDDVEATRLFWLAATRRLIYGRRIGKDAWAALQPRKSAPPEQIV